MISFSVIIPNYNHSSFLKQRLDSVLKQTYCGFELIILDDFSTDNSRDIIETFRDHDKISHILYNEKNSGSPFLQWKKGVELAKGDWIWIAESDDFADETFLEEVVLAISRYPTMGIFYSDSFEVNETNVKSGKKFSTRKNEVFITSKWNEPYFNNGIDEINECLKFDCTVNNISSVVCRKTLFTENINVLDRFKYYGDWAFLLSASFHSNIYYCPKPLNYYRKHSSSHLNAETSAIISRQEYFKILQLLYYSKNVTGKKHLLDHFVYNYLSFGFIKDGLKVSRKITRSYFRGDKSLALKIMLKIIAIKVFRKKRPFFVPVKRYNNPV